MADISGKYLNIKLSLSIVLAINHKLALISLNILLIQFQNYSFSLPVEGLYLT